MNQKCDERKRTMNGYNRPVRLRKKFAQGLVLSVSTDPTVLFSSRFTTVFASGVFTNPTRHDMHAIRQYHRTKISTENFQQCVLLELDDADI